MSFVSTITMVTTMCLMSYVLQYRTAQSPTRSLPASRRAFSSAWRQRHSSGVSLAELHRTQPPSLQLVSPRGVPLYL